MTRRLSDLTLENETQQKRISQLLDERNALSVEKNSLNDSNAELSKQLEVLSRQVGTIESKVSAMATALEQPGTTNSPTILSNVLP